jgi:hypothetical protein
MTVRTTLSAAVGAVTLIFSAVLSASASSAVPMSTQAGDALPDTCTLFSLCLPISLAFPQLTWTTHHDLVESSDCTKAIQLQTGESFALPFTDTTINSTDQGDWAIALKTSPAFDFYVSLPGGMRKVSPLAGTDAADILYVDESVVAETGNWIARWSNGGSEIFCVDSSVSEYSGGGFTEIPAESPWEPVTEIPSDALLLELEYQGPTAAESGSWGLVKTLFGR